jgi:hypothetical protein
MSSATLTRPALPGFAMVIFAIIGRVFAVVKTPGTHAKGATDAQSH